jgi:hypothetical protein
LMIVKNDGVPLGEASDSWKLRFQNSVASLLTHTADYFEVRPKKG